MSSSSEYSDGFGLLSQSRSTATWRGTLAEADAPVGNAGIRTKNAAKRRSDN